jgi:hypothetical protein
MNLLLMFFLGTFGFLCFILFLMGLFYLGKGIKAIRRWRSGAHE